MGSVKLARVSRGQFVVRSMRVELSDSTTLPSLDGGRAAPDFACISPTFAKHDAVFRPRIPQSSRTTINPLRLPASRSQFSSSFTLSPARRLRTQVRSAVV